MNVPTSITLENLNSTPTATFRTKLFGAENGQVKEAINKYELSINTIPTKEIRIFSAADNSIRTVKVNTELILGTNISSNDEQNRSGTLYLFNNKNGSISLITLTTLAMLRMIKRRYARSNSINNQKKENFILRSFLYYFRTLETHFSPHLFFLFLHPLSPR